MTSMDGYHVIKDASGAKFALGDLHLLSKAKELAVNGWMKFQEKQAKVPVLQPPPVLLQSLLH